MPELTLVVTPPCCEVWPKIECEFYWFTFTDHPEFQTMACIVVDGQDWRVNYCPVCGAERRSVIRAHPESAFDPKSGTYSRVPA